MHTFCIIQKSGIQINLFLGGNGKKLLKLIIHSVYCEYLCVVSESLVLEEKMTGEAEKGFQHQIVWQTERAGHLVKIHKQ